MKFRLSTLLLVFALVSVATGWAVDRNTRQYDEDAIVSREDISGHIFFARRFGAHYLSREPSDACKQLQARMVHSLILLWKHESEYNNSGFARDWYGTDIMARSFLEIVDSESPESFRDFASSLYRFKTEVEQQAENGANNSVVLHCGLADPLPNEENYPELHDPNSDEYKSFDVFLQRAFSRGSRD